MEPEQLYRSHFDAIERMAWAICRRKSMFDDDARDFVQEVHLKLVADHYATLRKFGGKSTLTTYLNAVVTNCFRDHRVKRWGKWRPPAKAQQLGAIAVQLSMLIDRDGHSVDEACKILRSQGVTQSQEELTRLATKLPRRPRRHFASGDHDVDLLRATDSANGMVIERERHDMMARAEGALDRALESLSPEDQVIIRMRFLEGFTVSDIARALHLDQRPLYDRIKTILRRLRGTLEAGGVSRDTLDDLLGDFG